MSNKVKVGDRLDFVNEANNHPNITGCPLPERMASIDWFDQTALDVTYDYTQTLGGTNDAGAVTAGGENGFKGTTGTGDNEISFLATGLIFDITQSPEIATKLEITDVSDTIVFFGFADATSETTPECYIDADSGTLRKGDNTTNAVGFVCDADLGSSSLYCASSNAGAAIQSVDTTVDWTDGDSHTLRLRLDTSGNALFYVDGIQRGNIASAVADVPLCAAIGYGMRNNDGGADTVYMRYLAKYQDLA